MNLLYNAGIALYGAAARLASHTSPKIRTMLRGQADTLSRLAGFRRTLAPEGFDVWFHAASLGEFEQARPLIEALLAAKPDVKILLSFFSPSGYEVRSDFNPRVAVVYLPLDRPDAVRQFLDAARPRMAVFVKYEFWGNYLSELSRRGIPTYIISAIFRPGQIFFRPWGGMFCRMLHAFDHLYVQDERSRNLLASVGVDNVTVAGDTRFDRVTAIRRGAKVIPEVETFLSAAPEGTLTLVAGSSWEHDEDVYVQWLQSTPGVRAIIAPHEFDSARLEAMVKRLGVDRTMLLSDFRTLCQNDPTEARRRAAALSYLIVDCFGLLSSLYRYADAAYVGGGFGVGIHNINEAAVYGIPVVFGPKHEKFNEAAGLIACGGGFCVASRAEAADVLGKLFGDPEARAAAGRAAGDYIATNVGATSKIMKDIFKIDIEQP